ncbi:potassium channel subfamily K member 17 isoform X1 [Macaca mulatta]
MYRPRTRAGPEDRGWGCAVPSTVLLLFAYLAYLALGTGVFWTLEGRAAQESSRSFQRDKWELLQNFTCLDRPALDSLIRDVVQAYKNGASLLSNTTGMGRWELLGSFFFSVSTITTIGYGNLSPNTMAARLFCIFFALVGIPLNLVVLNRLGHLMQQGVNHCSSRLGGTWQDPGKARWLAGSGALLSGLLLFLLLPPLLFSHMEGWSYMEGFYFAFITLSTVGFGDYVIAGDSRKGMFLLPPQLQGRLQVPKLETGPQPGARGPLPTARMLSRGTYGNRTASGTFCSGCRLLQGQLVILHSLFGHPPQ